jgi:starch synthase
MLLEEGMQFASVAEGDHRYQEGFKQLAMRYPGRAAVRIGYEEPRARRLVAGADMLLHPSRFEPCGLVPIYAMRYGTIPIVRRSGGMADTVVDATPETLKSGKATGFSFEPITAVELIACVRRAINLYRQPIPWRKLQASAMLQDFSWRNSAERYAAVYGSLVNEGTSGDRVTTGSGRASA